MAGFHDSHRPANRSRGATPHHQYSFLQPRFAAPRQPLLRRDRYRMSSRPQCDVDDIAYEDDDVFDSVEDNLSHKHLEVRQNHQGRGVSRLSFPPKELRQPYQEIHLQQKQQQSHSKIHRCSEQLAGSNDHYGAGEFAETSIDHGLRLATAEDEYRQDEHRQPRPDLSHFAYNAQHPAEPSSELPLATSSSPSLKAIHRRTGTQPSRPARAPPTTQHEIMKRHHHHGADNFSNLPAQQSTVSRGGPIIQGIPLVPVSEIPDRQRSLFPFPAFNAVQSKCFDQVYNSDDNFVLASPTGSGKTAVLELAICRAISNNATGQYKIIYQAPVKALCSERQTDWGMKFQPLGLRCAELTGDSDSTNLSQVQQADIIITTPEKWDSITRKWKDHSRLMKLIKLFLIDEVHILKEERGAILEAVVSRMKTTGTKVRFVALSATVPNLDDVAAWLGKNPDAPHIPANSAKFGEEFRPVKLTKHVLGFTGGSNDWQFEHVLNKKLPGIIAKYSQHKPIIVFCLARKSTSQTAKVLVDWWSNSGPHGRYWSAPRKSFSIKNPELKEYIGCGVAFHHAGLELGDRSTVEKGYLEGDIKVICCTSTLAVGVNLPCHLVIIKNTVKWDPTGTSECSDLEILQMMGRAGRPQFDDSAVAVIMTRQAKVHHYESMVTGHDTLESSLHRGLLEHLNAEIGLGSIQDLDSARDWLSKTFLYVRLKKNPAFYKLESSRSGATLEEQLDDICLRDLALLQESGLVREDHVYRCTDFGNAMARYYVAFDTMKHIVGLPARANISAILSALSLAAEFKNVRFRQGEKPLYKHVNSSPSTRFIIPEKLDLPAQKVSLIIQCVLGNVDILWSDKEMAAQRTQYMHDVHSVFKHVHRLIRCVADCQISLGDSVALNNALLLQRSLHSKAWDDGPYHMVQLPNIGPVTVRKFVAGGIKSIEDLEAAEAHRIEIILKKNPPFGLKMLQEVRLFPRLFVSAKIVPNSMKRTDDGVEIQTKVNFGFLNRKPVETWNQSSVYVCFLVETSDGHLSLFRRYSGRNFDRGQDLVFPVLMTSPDLSINCYVMCDQIAGTLRETTVRPKIALSMFPTPNIPASKHVAARIERPESNISKRRTETRRSAGETSDEFDDDGLDDDELVQASLADLDFDHIENYANPNDALTLKNTATNASKKGAISGRPRLKSAEGDTAGSVQLANGNWACRHRCKDKMGCKHLCCKEGLDKPQKSSGNGSVTAQPPGVDARAKKDALRGSGNMTQTKLTPLRRKAAMDMVTLDLTQMEKRPKVGLARKEPRDIRILRQLHNGTQNDGQPSVSVKIHKGPTHGFSANDAYSLSFMGDNQSDRGDTAISTDYDNFTTGDLQELDGFIPGESRLEKEGEEQTKLVSLQKESISPVPSNHFSDSVSDQFDDKSSMLEEAMVGLADFQELQATYSNHEGDDFGDFDCDDIEMNHDPVEKKEKETSKIITRTGRKKTSRPVVVDSSSSLFIKQSPLAKRGVNNAFSISQIEANTDTPSSRCIGTCDAADDFIKSHDRVDKRDGFRPASAVWRQQTFHTRKDNNMDAIRENVPTTKLTRTNSQGKIIENTQMESPVPTQAIPFRAQEQVLNERLKDLEPWFLKEFGDVVELMDE